jgi:uncharacterized repeat protein (TIGR02543 family)
MNRIAFLSACSLFFFGACQLGSENNQRCFEVTGASPDWKGFNRLVVILFNEKDEAVDTLFNDSLSSPVRLQKLCTEKYPEGKYSVDIIGHRDGKVVLHQRRTRDQSGKISIDTLVNLAKTFSLNITAPNGSVTRSPNAADYDSGAKVILAATAHAGYKFTGWTGDLTVGDNPATITMDRNKNIGAEFTPMLIDDFEDGNLVCKISDSAWYQFIFDATNSTNKLSVTAAPTHHLRADFNIKQPDLTFVNHVAIILKLPADFTLGKGSKYKGIRFSYASTHSDSAGVFRIKAESRDVSDFDFHTFRLKNTGGAWEGLSLTWGDFAQMGFGNPVGPLQGDDVVGLQFVIEGAGQGSFQLDDVTFTGF